MTDRYVIHVETNSGDDLPRLRMLLKRIGRQLGLRAVKIVEADAKFGREKRPPVETDSRPVQNRKPVRAAGNRPRRRTSEERA